MWKLIFSNLKMLLMSFNNHWVRDLSWGLGTETDWQLTQGGWDGAELILGCESVRQTGTQITQWVTPEPVHIWYQEKTPSPQATHGFHRGYMGRSTLACKEKTWGNNLSPPPFAFGDLLDASPAGSTWPTFYPDSFFFPFHFRFSGWLGSPYIAVMTSTGNML